MSRLLPLLILSVVVGCRPTYEDYKREDDVAFQGYMTGGVHTAKASLLQIEQILAKHEGRGNRGVDFRAARRVLYGQLCGICDYMGQTNEAKAYFQKSVENRDDKQMTYDELLVRAKKHDHLLKPKWREKQ